MDFDRASEQENNLQDLQDFARRNAEQEKKKKSTRSTRFRSLASRRKKNSQVLQDFSRLRAGKEQSTGFTKFLSAFSLSVFPSFVSLFFGKEGYDRCNGLSLCSLLRKILTKRSNKIIKYQLQ